METDMDIMQYRQSLDDDTIDRIMDDPKAVSIIRYLNWATLSEDELDELVPGNDDSLNLLLRSGVVVREGEFFNLDVAVQSSCFRSDRMDDIREASGSSSVSCIRSLGYQSAYMADSLVSLYFGNEPCWDCGSEELAYRAGLIDSDGK